MNSFEPIAPLLSSRPLAELVAQESWSSPKRVKVFPQSDSKIDQCYANVAHQIDRAGGQGEYCWKVLEFPRLFLQAIHHAVWIDRQGRVVDVTPDVRKWGQMVVVFDTDHIFSGVPVSAILPRFLNICGLTEIDEMIDVSLRLTQLRIASALPNGLMPQLDHVQPEVLDLLNRARWLCSAAQGKVAAQ